jgi:hypothetical protein
MQKLKDKKCENQNYTFRELGESEAINQINLSGLNEAVNIISNDKSKDIFSLMDKALDVFLKIRTDNPNNQDEIQ